MPTRGQAKRALAWIDFTRRSRLKRGDKDLPTCVSCGARPTHDFAKGEPAYGCGPHEPLRITRADLERARKEFGAK